MKLSQFRPYLDRDKCCYHCGTTIDLIPHHRLNRGMGGSKARHVPSNIIAMCSWFNGVMESDAGAAAWAERMGWKLRSGQDPRSTPVHGVLSTKIYLLDDNFGRIEIAAN